MIFADCPIEPALAQVHQENSGLAVSPSHFRHVSVSEFH